MSVHLVTVAGLALALAASLGGCSRRAAEAASSQPVLTGVVSKVNDGDTLEVRLASGQVTVRLHSIDAPERDQPHGRDAFAALYERVGNRSVELQIVEQDQYDRQVAVVLVEGRNINAELVREGHAWAYRQYLSDEEFCHLEEAARVGKTGLWALSPDKQIAPWEWRNLQRGEKFIPTDYLRKTVADCVAAAGLRMTSPRETVDCVIKGNISDNGRIYHLPGSRDYERTRIDPSHGERWFCSEQEAREQGWRRADGR